MPAYTHTLADARVAGLDDAAGACSDSAQFTQWLNEVQRRILKRGGWWGTDWVVKMCVYSGCITWPRYVGTVLGLRFCSTGAADIRNNWYSILRPWTCGSRFGGANVVAADNGTAPCFNEITGGSKIIRAYLEHGNDAGKTITIYGIDADTNQNLQEQVNGVWRAGITLTLAAPYVASTHNVKRITSVTKEKTQGQVFLYEYDTATTTLGDLARYEPNETNPRYRRSKIHGFCGTSTCAPSDGVSYRTVEALVSLEFVPVENEYDFLLIDDFDALMLGMQALRLEKAGDDAGAEIKFNKAIREMNFTDRNKSPGQQTTVSVDSGAGHICSPM